MKSIISNPFILFFIATPAIILAGYFDREEVLDFHLYDVMFVISYEFFAILLAIGCGLLGIGYWFMYKAKKHLSTWMNLIHIFFTFGSMLSIWSILSFPIESGVAEINNITNQNLIITNFLMLMIFGQLIFTANIVVGLFGNKKNKVQ